MIIVTQPSRKKMNEAIGNLNVTLESVYLKAWKDGYNAGVKECNRLAEIESLKELKGEFKLSDSTSETISKYLDDVYEKENNNVCGKIE